MVKPASLTTMAKSSDSQKECPLDRGSNSWALYNINITIFKGICKTRLTYNCAHLRSTKEKKEENIWGRKIFFAEGGGKEG